MIFLSTSISFDQIKMVTEMCRRFSIFFIPQSSRLSQLFNLLRRAFYALMTSSLSPILHLSSRIFVSKATRGKRVLEKIYWFYALALRCIFYLISTIFYCCERRKKASHGRTGKEVGGRKIMLVIVWTQQSTKGFHSRFSPNSVVKSKCLAYSKTFPSSFRSLK